MSMDFGSAKKAAEFACDVIYVRGGPECANAWSDEFYTVRPDKPRVRFDDRLRTWWVEVTAEYIDYCDFKSSAAGTTTRLDAKNEAAEVQ
jgi:hypothetical protein